MLHHIDIFPETIIKEIELGDQPIIHPSCSIKKSQIGSWCALGPNTSLNESIFGDYSYTSGNVSITWTEVGKFCSIASGVRINPGNHPQWRVTQHHSTYRRKNYNLDGVDDHEFFQWRKDHDCKIGHDVWIGTRALIMAGVKIGIGAVIGAGAVVTKDIGDYEVAVGVPARVIKKRFSDVVVMKLLNSQWWNWDRKTLEKRFKDFMNANQFVEKYC
jgi:hypothetical protein